LLLVQVGGKTKILDSRRAQCWRKMQLYSRIRRKSDKFFNLRCSWMIKCRQSGSRSLRHHIGRISSISTWWQTEVCVY